MDSLRVDGGKGIRKALVDVHLAVIQRCQIHKLRFVVPSQVRHAYVLQLKEAYKCKSADKARKRLQALVSWLERNGYTKLPEAFVKGWKKHSRS